MPNLPGWVWLVGLTALVALLVLGPSTSRTECDKEGKVYVWGYGCVYPQTN
jgi:hypothetical protein